MGSPCYDLQYTIEKFQFHRHPAKGRTIRKVMGGGAGVMQKKYSRKGKLNEKKFMHAN